MLSNVWKKKEINEWGVLFQTTAYVYWNENHCLESSLISVRVAYCFLFARNRLNIPAIPLQLLSLFTERHFIWHLTQFSDLSEIPCGVYIYFSFTYWCNRIIYFMLSYVCVMNIHDGWWWEVIKGCKTPGKREEKDNWSWKLFLNYLCVTSRRSHTECIHFLFSFFLAQCRRPSCHYFCSVAPAFTYSDINANNDRVRAGPWMVSKGSEFIGLKIKP